MSNRPANRHPAPSTDRPTATYPTADHLARLGAHRQRLADLWADATPTEELPIVDRPAPARFVRTNGPQAGPEQPSHFVRTNSPAQPEQAEPLCQDMGRPGILRRLPAWHPSLMQLAIGAALVAALLGACNVAAIQGYPQAASHTSSPAPSAASGARAHDTPPPPHPSWVTRDTGAAYDRTDLDASPLTLPRCTAAPDTPLPCLAHVSADSRHVVVLEEDASLTSLVRR